MHDVGVSTLVATIAVALSGDAGGRGRAWPAAPVAGAAVGLHASSRTGGPLCRPDSLWQGHAAWHLMIAVAIWLAARRAD